LIRRGLYRRIEDKSATRFSISGDILRYVKSHLDTILSTGKCRKELEIRAFRRSLKSAKSPYLFAI